MMMLKTRPQGTVRRWLPRTPRQIGHRGAILFVFGILYIVMGLSVLDSTAAVPGVFHHEISPRIRGWAWIITGCVAAFYAFRPHTLSDAIGFLALYIMPTMRVMSYLLAWIDSWSWVAFLNGPGYADGWKFACVYGVMVATVMITASWPNPPVAPSVEEEDVAR